MAPSRLQDTDKLLYALKKAILFKSPFVEIDQNKLTATNGIATLVQNIKEDFTAYPEAKKLKDILTKCNGEYAITSFSDTVISVVSEKFRGLVNCSEDEYQEKIQQETYAEPDMPSIKANDRLVHALSRACLAATCDAALPISHCVFLGPSSAIASDGKAIVECVHGLDVPGICSIPADTVKLLARLKMEPLKIGGSSNSITLHFEGGDFLKLSLSNVQYTPKIYHWLTAAKNECQFSYDLTSEIANAIDLVGTTSKEKVIIFSKNGIVSNEVIGDATRYDIEFSDKAFVFPYAKLKPLKGVVGGHFGFGEFSENGYAYLYYENEDKTERGVIMGMTAKEKTENEKQLDDEIPF